MRHVVRAVAAVVALGLAGCSSGMQHPVHEVTAQADGGVQRITVTTHSFWFDPNRIVVTKGVPVELTVKNGALMVPHDFSCDAQQAGISIDESVGMFHGHKMVRFTPTQAGEYEFFCDVDSHAKKHGMKGTLVVVER